MNKKRNLKIKIKALLILLVVMLTGLQSFNHLFENSYDSNTKGDEENDEISPTEPPQLSLVSPETWWNQSFQYRMLINITNPYNEDLINQGVNISFNYNQLGINIQFDLEDIRIVENGALRKYYFIKDDPAVNFVNVWFETNVSAKTTEYDTFLYYGNDSVGIAEDYYMDERFGNAWYRLEQNAQDSSGNGNHGSIGGDPQYVAGKIEKSALDFDGSGDYIQVSDSPSLSMSEEISISFWVNIKGGSQTAIRKDGSDYLFEFGTNGGNTAGTNPQFYVRTSTGRTYIYGIGAYSALGYNTWYHCIGTYHYEDGAKMYIDGQQATVSTQQQLGTINDQNSYLRIGTWGSERFEGIIDDARFFDHVLTEEEIEFLYSFNRTLVVKLNEEQEKKASIKVIAKDSYNNPIPYANISIYNKTADPINPLDSNIAGVDGSVTFEELYLGNYNFSVFISSNINGYTVKVNETSNPYFIDGILQEITLICNVSSHTFNVRDVDGAPVESGFIIVGNDTVGFGQIQNCTIDQTGTAKFWWVKATPYEYNYTVKYRNPNFNPNEVTLATGKTNTPNETITVYTNLTTVSFTLIKNDDIIPIPGAKLNLTRYGTYENIVNLTTDANGIATLRWLNSSGINDDYNLRIDFWGAVAFNTSTGGGSTELKWRFTVSKQKMYILEVATDPDAYKTQLVSLNPTDDIKTKWGSMLKLRYLFNVTQAGATSDPDLEGPTYADSMTYKIIKGQNIILSDLLPKEQDNEGIHQVTIDTSGLQSDETYTIEVSAIKSGFTTPEKVNAQLYVKKYDILLNQSENDDTSQTVYWLESVNMSVIPYGENDESFVIEDSLFKEPDNNNYNLDFWIPGLNTNWNLSRIIFNVYNVTFNVPIDDININITDDFGIKHTFNKNNADYEYYQQGAPNGTWVDLVIELNEISITNNNTFSFTFEGTFSGTIDVVAIASFLRDEIHVEYRKFNVTDDICILADGNGWAIKNITFSLSNCYNTTSWAIINPANVIDNITTNEGHKYDFINGANDGTGNLTISDRIINPIDDQFLFFIGNISKDIIFDVIIKVEYIQEFYWNTYLEINNISKSKQDIGDQGKFRVSFDGYDWNNQGILIYIENLPVSPSEAGLNFTFDGLTYYYFDDFGTLYIEEIELNKLLTVIIKSNQPVTFDLYFITSFSRTVYYEIQATINYEIRQAPEVTGPVPYQEDLNYYQIELDTSQIDADDYTVRFTATKEHYNSDDKDLYLEVLERVTLLNGNSRDPTNIIATIYVKDSVNFTFTFRDRDLDLLIEDLDIKSWSWWIGNTEQESGDLVFDTQNDYYVLDFDTETRAVGTYSVTIKFSKDNYQSKLATITLRISLRTMDYDLGDEFDDKIASVVKGKIITLSIELTDSTRGDIPLTGAKVVLEIGDDKLEFDEEDDGVYELEFNTKDYEAFFTSNTLTGTIKITRVDFEDEEVDITIVVEMEEVVEGVPTFYFLMVVSAIAAIVGSLATYRYIQIARIPTFVKKARKAKKAIKSGDKISEALLYPSKEEFIVKTLGAKYNALGLSLEDLLGLKGKGKTEDSLKKNGGVK